MCSASWKAIGFLLGAGALATACGNESNRPAAGGAAAGPTNSSGGASSGASASTAGAGSAATGAVSGRSGATSGGNGATAGDASGGQASAGASGERPAACKRGVAYGHHSLADLQALSAGVSWWYNWDFRPDQALRTGEYRNLGVEYAPMIWGAATDRQAASTAIADDAHVLLGFNEPNFGAQANLSAKAAADLWPELEAIADAKGLRLASPAVNFCGGNCQDTDPFRYLDAFFAACSGCRVDVVAMHLYVGCTPTGNNKAEWLINHVETYKSRFKQPLWLTEFACDNAKDSAEQQAFLEDAVAYLEAEPRIERYAWFSARASNVPHVDLLGDSGQLTTLGKAYVNAPQNSDCAR